LKPIWATSAVRHDISTSAPRGCLTKKADGDCELSPDLAKPRFSVIAQIHAAGSRWGG